MRHGVPLRSSWIEESRDRMRLRPWRVGNNLVKSRMDAVNGARNGKLGSCSVAPLTRVGSGVRAARAHARARARRGGWAPCLAVEHLLGCWAQRIVVFGATLDGEVDWRVEEGRPRRRRGATRSAVRRQGREVANSRRICTSRRCHALTPDLQPFRLPLLTENVTTGIYIVVVPLLQQQLSVHWQDTVSFVRARRSRARSPGCPATVLRKRVSFVK